MTQPFGNRRKWDAWFPAIAEFSKTKYINHTRDVPYVFCMNTGEVHTLNFRERKTIQGLCKYLSINLSCNFYN